MNVFLKPFAKDMTELSSGFDSITFRSRVEVNIKVHTLLGSVDAPARCKCQGLKQYNGKYGCPYCLHEAEPVEPGKLSARIYRGDCGHARTVQQHIRD